MLRTCTFLGAFLVLGSVQATHIIGGELYYDHMGGSQYQVTLKLYRDCTGIPFDDAARIAVFDGDGTALFTQLLTFPGGTFIPITLETPCLSLPPDVCVETTSYVGIFDLPATPNGYVLTYQRCCRTGIITNLVDPGSLGVTVTTRIPGQEIVSNSSARFNELPPVALCLDAELVFDHSATDPDGDQLFYQLCTPFNGGSIGDPQPLQPSPPPYAPLPWLAPYTETSPIDSDPGISIDPVTGQLTLTPTLQGSFTIGVCVQEFRDGVLLTETRRDFLFKVVACDATVVAAIQSQSTTPQEICDDLEMPFSDNSFGAQSWHWDFGDGSMDSDTSDLENPNWTYLSQGTYTVTLVANPGTTCSDTTQASFEVYLTPEPFIATPPPACGNDPVELRAEGIYGATATLDWQLGVGSEPATSDASAVTVQFPSTGTHPVTLSVTENGCFSSYTTNIVNRPQPIADLNVFPASPQLVGVPVQLTDATQTSGGSITSWSWTIDDQPIGANAPAATWVSTWPGVYRVGLVVVDAEGCSDLVEFFYTVEGGPISVPNVFSPNGDGNNETFNIVNVDHYSNELVVYSRWGNEVYSAQNYRNQWDGSGVPDGTYFYVLKINKKESISGHVTLLR